VIDMEQAYRDLVSLEAKGQAPEGTRERLMADPERWFAMLRDIQQDLSAQVALRESDLEEIKAATFRMPDPDGRICYAGHKADFLRWKGGMVHFRKKIDVRLTEVAALARTAKRTANIAAADAKKMDEVKRNCGVLVAAVEALLAVPDDQPIPTDLWDALEASHDALPEWLRQQGKYREQELTEAAD
jgi:hypothetical protein